MRALVSSALLSVATIVGVASAQVTQQAPAPPPVVLESYVVATKPTSSSYTLVTACSHLEARMGWSNSWEEVGDRTISALTDFTIAMQIGDRRIDIPVKAQDAFGQIAAIESATADCGVNRDLSHNGKLNVTLVATGLSRKAWPEYEACQKRKDYWNWSSHWTFWLDADGKIESQFFRAPRCEKRKS